MKIRNDGKVTPTTSPRLLSMSKSTQTPRRGPPRAGLTARWTTTSLNGSSGLISSPVSEAEIGCSMSSAAVLLIDSSIPLVLSWKRCGSQSSKVGQHSLAFSPERRVEGSDQKHCP